MTETAWTYSDLPYARELKTQLPQSESELRGTLAEALGAASACWENLSGAGIFESDRCSEIHKKLCDDVIDITALGKPHLGLATNAELEAELKARQEMGHTDPDYRTVNNG